MNGFNMLTTKTIEMWDLLDLYYGTFLFANYVDFTSSNLEEYIRSASMNLSFIKSFEFLYKQLHNL